jgi:hypothetical protein
MTFYKNHQWALTDYGLECVDPRWECPIAAHRLLDTTVVWGRKLYSWPVTLAGKMWVDIEAFVPAFRRALRLHKDKYKGSVNRRTLEDSLYVAGDIASDIPRLQRTPVSPPKALQRCSAAEGVGSGV